MEGFNFNIDMFNPLEIKLARPTMIVHGIVSQILFFSVQMQRRFIQERLYAIHLHIESLIHMA